MKIENLNLIYFEKKYSNFIEEKIEFNDLNIMHNIPISIHEDLKDQCRNILAFKKSDGSFYWKINLFNNLSKSYTSMGFVNQNGKDIFRVYNCDGYFYVVDIETGNVSDWTDPSWPPGYKPRPW